MIQITISSNHNLIIIENGESCPLIVDIPSHNSSLDSYTKEWYSNLKESISGYGLSQNCVASLLHCALHSTIENMPSNIRIAKFYLRRQKNAILSEKEIEDIINTLFK